MQSYCNENRVVFLAHSVYSAVTISSLSIVRLYIFFNLRVFSGAMTVIIPERTLCMFCSCLLLSGIKYKKTCQFTILCNDNQVTHPNSV